MFVISRNSLVKLNQYLQFPLSNHRSGSNIWQGTVTFAILSPPLSFGPASFYLSNMATFSCYFCPVAIFNLQERHLICSRCCSLHGRACFGTETVYRRWFCSSFTNATLMRVILWVIYQGRTSWKYSIGLDFELPTWTMRLMSKFSLKRELLPEWSSK